MLEIKTKDTRIVEVITWRGQNVQWFRGDYSFRLDLISSKILLAELFVIMSRHILMEHVAQRPEDEATRIIPY